MRRDVKSLNLVIRYCDDVASDIARFGDDIEDLTDDESYRRSTAESIELIGERAKRLSDDVTPLQGSRLARDLQDARFHGASIRGGRPGVPVVHRGRSDSDRSMSIRWTSVPDAELTSRMIQLCFREIRPSMKRYFVRNRLSANRYSVIVLHP